ncbi:hypothetical protein EUX98_g987 [Antrodiella citrinella]|uniref:Aminotransferase class V domain-containing protein n=1 Tax=Antrodiella citrinella TaxID=2447956 RepID=A0A4S4NB81_9APHY|nr:hypothetical protein EUX98_g987 [Antrodiella citrinella]
MSELLTGEGYTYDPNSAPPAFGHSLRKFWAFDKGYVNLNHGSYGSQPLPVFAASTKLLLQAERNPDQFHRRTYMLLLVESRRLVAELVGAKLDEVVLVPNATHGLNTVLRNIEWREGDILLGTSTTYGAITKTLHYLGDRSEQPHPSVYSVTYTFPMTHQQIIDAFRARVRELKQLHPQTQFTNLPGSPDDKGNRFVAVIDSIASNPGVLLPWKELVKVCVEEGIWSVLDAAHSVGQEPDINLRTGTQDQVPYLSVKFAIDFRNWLGGEHKINAYCHDLAVKGGIRLADVLDTNILDESGELTLNMTNVLLPLPVDIPGKSPVYTHENLPLMNIMLREKLLDDWNVYAAHYFHAGAWWVRISDFEYLGKALIEVCKEVKEKFFSEETV